MILYLIGVVISTGLFIIMFIKDPNWEADVGDNLNVASLIIAALIVSSWFFVLAYSIYSLLEYYKENR